MDNHQTARLKVMRAAHVTLLDNKDLWIGLPAVVKAVGDLNAVKEELKAGAEDQAQRTQGATAAQLASRRELRDDARGFSTLLVDYAIELGSPELADSMRVSNRALIRSRLEDTLTEARRIEKLAAEHAVAFAGFLKDPDSVKTFGDKVTAYEKLMGKPRRVVIKRATATKRVDSAMRRGERLLKKLDVAVKQFAKEAPEFVIEWGHALKGRAPQPAPQEDTPTPPTSPANAVVPPTLPKAA